MDLQIGSINKTFTREGIVGNDLVSQQMLYQILNRMNQEDAFDKELFIYFWEDCEQNSNGEVLAFDFINVIYKRVSILQSKIQNMDKQLKILEAAKYESEQSYNKEEDFLKRHEMQKNLAKTIEKISQLNIDKQQFQSDLEIIYKLFEKEHHILKSLKTFAQQQQPDTCTAEVLMFGLNLFGLLSQLIMTFSKKGFFNLLVYTLILGYYIHRNPPRIFWLFTTSMMVLSIITDLLWTYLYGSYLWNGRFTPSTLVELQKYCLIFTNGLIVLKVFITLILYYTFRPIHDIDKSEISRSQKGFQT